MKTASKRKIAVGVQGRTMTRKYGSRAIQVASRLRNLAKTAKQRNRWTKVIRWLEKDLAFRKSRHKKARVVSSKKVVKRNPEFGRSLKKTYRVVAVVRGRIFYLHTGPRLDSSKSGSLSYPSEGLARHRAYHMALSHPRYKWGVERP